MRTRGPWARQAPFKEDMTWNRSMSYQEEIDIRGLLELITEDPMRLPELRHLLNSNEITYEELVTTYCRVVQTAQDSKNMGLICGLLELVDLLVRVGSINFILYLMVPLLVTVGAVKLSEFCDTLLGVVTDASVAPHVVEKAEYCLFSWREGYKLVLSIRAVFDLVQLQFDKLGVLSGQYATSEVSLMGDEFLNTTKLPEDIVSNYCLLSLVPFDQVLTKKFRCLNCGGLFLRLYSMRLPLIHLEIYELVKVCTPCFEIVKAKYEKRLEKKRNASISEFHVRRPTEDSSHNLPKISESQSNIAGIAAADLEEDSPMMTSANDNTFAFESTSPVSPVVSKLSQTTVPSKSSSYPNLPNQQILLLPPKKYSSLLNLPNLRPSSGTQFNQQTSSATFVEPSPPVPPVPPQPPLPSIPLLPGQIDTVLGHLSDTQLSSADIDFIGYISFRLLQLEIGVFTSQDLQNVRIDRASLLRFQISEIQARIASSLETLAKAQHAFYEFEKNYLELKQKVHRMSGAL